MVDEKVTHALIVAKELQDAGFWTNATSDGVEVRLSNRQVSKMEVEIVLDKMYEIDFQLLSLSKGVFVIV